MTKQVIDHVDAIGNKQGMPSGLKIDNRYNTTLYDSDWIAGVDYEDTNKNNDESDTESDELDDDIEDDEYDDDEYDDDEYCIERQHKLYEARKERKVEFRKKNKTFED